MRLSPAGCQYMAGNHGPTVGSCGCVARRYGQWRSSEPVRLTASKEMGRNLNLDLGCKGLNSASKKRARQGLAARRPRTYEAAVFMPHSQ